MSKKFALVALAIIVASVTLMVVFATKSVGEAEEIPTTTSGSPREAPVVPSSTTVRSTTTTTTVVSTTSVASTTAPPTTVVAPPPPPAPTPPPRAPESMDAHLWRIAKCESGTNPRAVSSSGAFRGAWQFATSTWLAYGGGQFARDPILASLDQQLVIARAVYRGGGPGSWPICQYR